MVKKSDVIIVLGAAVWQGGRPSPAILRRVLHAVNLLNAGRAPFIIFTGGLGKHPPSEAIVMQAVAEKEGVEEEKMVLEEKATSTYESALNCIKIMRDRNWSTAIIVSDSYHVFRSVFLFRLLGVKAVGSSAPGGRESNPTWKWLYYHLREIAAIPWYLILVFINKHSKKIESSPD